MEGCTGQVMLWAGTWAPKNWAFCDGQQLPIPQNGALFSLLGTSYGGDGVKTFGLPDLRGRVPVHIGQSAPVNLQPRHLGEAFGAETVTLNLAQLPPHAHGVQVATTTAAGTTNDPTNAAIASGGAVKAFAPAGTKPVGSLAVAVQPIGNGSPVPTAPPSLGLNYIICIYGSYPDRD